MVREPPARAGDCPASWRSRTTSTGYTSSPTSPTATLLDWSEEHHMHGDEHVMRVVNEVDQPTLWRAFAKLEPSVDAGHEGAPAGAGAPRMSCSGLFASQPGCEGASFRLL
jgi:hypothetical protein